MFKKSLRAAGALALSLLLGFSTLTQLACDRPALIQHSKRVSRSAKVVVPIFEKNGVSTARLMIAIGIADRLIAAFEKADNADALAAASELITEFDLIIAEDVIRIPPGATRTIVLVGLAVGNEALHYISETLEEEAAKVETSNATTARASRAMRPKAQDPLQTIRDFNKRAKWRCRDSQSGQFKKMDYCKANPATSQVETY